VDDFEVAEVDVPPPGVGQVLVRNTWLSIDPYIRLLLNDGGSAVFPSTKIGDALEGAAVGAVVASRSDTIPIGAMVSHFLGWREYSIVDASELSIIDTELAPASAYLGALGTTGLTAYAVLIDVTPIRPGDIVFVSAAAGAAGSVAGQLARNLGAAKVIGSAGGAVKSRKLVEVFGFDVGIDYRAGDLPTQLAQAAPDGIDLYLDHVGGDHLEAALEAMRPGGRIALVGAISGYNATEPTLAPRNLFRAVEKELTLRGTQVTSYFRMFPDYIKQAAAWLAEGTLLTEETVLTGLDQAPTAFVGVLSGANTGKMLVHLPH
jgi:NADPH-dependent curcumin reductase CurA